MSKDDWRYEYLSDQLRDQKKRLEDAEKMVKEAQSEVAALEWQRDKAKAIVEMLEEMIYYFKDVAINQSGIDASFFDAMVHFRKQKEAKLEHLLSNANEKTSDVK